MPTNCEAQPQGLNEILSEFTLQAINLWAIWLVYGDNSEAPSVDVEWMNTFAAPLFPFHAVHRLFGSVVSNIRVWCACVADVLFIIKTDELTSHRATLLARTKCIYCFSVLICHTKWMPLVHRIRRQLINVYSHLYLWWVIKKVWQSLCLYMHAITSHNQRN